VLAPPCANKRVGYQEPRVKGLGPLPFGCPFELYYKLKYNCNHMYVKNLCGGVLVVGAMLRLMEVMGSTPIELHKFYITLVIIGQWEVTTG
jgi:hypothetical protein